MHHPLYYVLPLVKLYIFILVVLLIILVTVTSTILDVLEIKELDGKFTVKVTFEISGFFMNRPSLNDCISCMQLELLEYFFFNSHKDL